jgi:hypothetical protein
MAFRVARMVRVKSGTITARKAIPCGSKGPCAVLYGGAESTVQRPP